MNCKYCNQTNFVKNQICKLCNIIYNFNNNNIYSIILVKSKLSQDEICFNTINFFVKNNYFPSPFDIDKKCKIINYSPYKFIKIRDKIEEKYQKKFYKFKIFFTDESLPVCKSLFKNNDNKNNEELILIKKKIKNKKIKILDNYFNLIL